MQEVPKGPWNKPNREIANPLPPRWDHPRLLAFIELVHRNGGHLAMGRHAIGAEMNCTPNSARRYALWAEAYGIVDAEFKGWGRTRTYTMRITPEQWAEVGKVRVKEIRSRLNPTRHKTVKLALTRTQWSNMLDVARAAVAAELEQRAPSPKLRLPPPTILTTEEIDTWSHLN